MEVRKNVPVESGEIDINLLRVHPHNLSLYHRASCLKDEAVTAAREETRESIRDHGVRRPIAIDEQNRILDGADRWTFSKEAGHAQVPFERFRFETEAEIEEFIDESNGEKPLTSWQRTERARRRAEHNRPKMGPKKSSANFAEDSQAHVSQQVADETGVSKRSAETHIQTAQYVEELEEKAEAGDETAAADAAEIVEAATNPTAGKKKADKVRERRGEKKTKKAAKKNPKVKAKSRSSKPPFDRREAEKAWGQFVRAHLDGPHDVLDLPVKVTGPFMASLGKALTHAFDRTEELQGEAIRKGVS